MRDTLQIECFAQALESYSDAIADEATARANYNGYSWGYHGEYYVNRKTQAAIALEDALSKMIDERVSSAVARLMAPLK